MCVWVIGTQNLNLGALRAPEGPRGDSSGESCYRHTLPQVLQRFTWECLAQTPNDLAQNVSVQIRFTAPVAHKVILFSWNISKSVLLFFPTHKHNVSVFVRLRKDQPQQRQQQQQHSTNRRQMQDGGWWLLLHTAAHMSQRSQCGFVLHCGFVYKYNRHGGVCECDMG